MNVGFAPTNDIRNIIQICARDSDIIAALNPSNFPNKISIILPEFIQLGLVSPWSLRFCNDSSAGGCEMRLGNAELFVLSDGEWRLDGGSIFGVVPRTLWEKVLPPDELNRVPQY